MRRYFEFRSTLGRLCDACIILANRHSWNSRVTIIGTRHLIVAWHWHPADRGEDGSQTQLMTSDRLVEAVANAWMRHQGYTEAQVDRAAAIQSHSDAGCGFDGFDWDCRYEDGESRHPVLDALVEATDMANVAIETLAQLVMPRVGLWNSW